MERKETGIVLTPKVHRTQPKSLLEKNISERRVSMIMMRNSLLGSVGLVISLWKTSRSASFLLLNCNSTCWCMKATLWKLWRNSRRGLKEKSIKVSKQYEAPNLDPPAELQGNGHCSPDTILDHSSISVQAPQKTAAETTEGQDDWRV